jgi:hypothetical protein
VRSEAEWYISSYSTPDEAVRVELHPEAAAPSNATSEKYNMAFMAVGEAKVKDLSRKYGGLIKQ